MYIGKEDNDEKNLRKVRSKEDLPFGELFPLL
ncbi:unnamed protein product [Toxocara canis]|nr:unnamed protein product [Toxocara canis]